VFLPYIRAGKSVKSVPSFSPAGASGVNTLNDLKNQQLTELDLTV
jgi:hypothetical protein